MTKIIAITGKRGSGKDTAAMGLYQDSYKHMSFADPLREATQIIYGITMEEMLDPVLKEQKLDRYPFMSPREVLIKFGTNAVRDQIDQDTWVQAFVRRSQDYDRVVVSDLRFLNEEKVLKKAGALIVRIINPNREDTDAVSQHRSEAEMDAIKPHFTIINDGTIEDLQTALRVMAHDYADAIDQDIANHYETITMRY